MELLFIQYINLSAPCLMPQSLGEIKLLKRLNEADPSDSKNIMRMFDYFYHKVAL